MTNIIFYNPGFSYDIDKEKRKRIFITTYQFDNGSMMYKQIN